MSISGVGVGVGVGVGERGDWFHHFEHAPSSGKNIDALDGLRAVAVVMIFVRHAWGLAGAPATTIPLGFAEGPLLAVGFGLIVFGVVTSGLSR